MQQNNKRSFLSPNIPFIKETIETYTMQSQFGNTYFLQAKLKVNLFMPMSSALK